MKTTDPLSSSQLAEALLAAAQRAAPGLTIRAASAMAARDAGPFFFVHGNADDGTELCANGSTLEQAADALREKIKQAPKPSGLDACAP